MEPFRCAASSRGWPRDALFASCAGSFKVRNTFENRVG